MLLWHRQLHLIDHGAALVFHHSWRAGAQSASVAAQVERFADAPYAVADHALVECRPDVRAADAHVDGVDWPGLVDAAVEAVPGEWLDAALGGEAQVRAAYREFLLARLAARPRWVPDLVEAAARGAARDEGGHRIPSRGRMRP
jgi:hypothetical protein